MWVTTFNINGIKARHDRLVNWIDQYYPPVLCLQETKCQDANFPYSSLTKYYKHISHAGQPKNNGVAILSKYKMTNIESCPFFSDQRRVIAATIKGIRFINVYVPQGQNTASEKFAYKLNWLMELSKWLKHQTETYKDIVVLGDFNICPSNDDVWSTRHWHDGVVSCTPIEREIFAHLLNEHDLVDSIRNLTDEQVFTWWGYVDWKSAPLKRGVRIDHVLHSKHLKSTSFHIDKKERQHATGASDHTAVSVKLA